MIGINGWELLLLLFLAVVILGPERLPEYAAKLARGIRKLRMMAEGAKGQLKEQLGPEYQDINWRQYDPRQYDPRRIVREALTEPLQSTREALQDVSSPDLGAADRAHAAGVQRDAGVAGGVGTAAAGAVGVDGAGSGATATGVTAAAVGAAAAMGVSGGAAAHNGAAVGSGPTVVAAGGHARLRTPFDDDAT